MTRYLIAYGLTAAVFLALDSVWLARVARGFYVDKLGHLLLERPHAGAAAGFYLVYIAGIVFFAVAPALRSGTVTTALINGAVFGLMAYAAYNMTNFATLKNWPVSVTVVDIAWGTALTTIAAVAGTVGTRLIAGS